MEKTHWLLRMDYPKLRFLHPEGTLNRAKLEIFWRLSTSELILSLAPGHPGSLKTRVDRTMLDGHHRCSVLSERGEDIHRLPRDIMGTDG